MFFKTFKTSVMELLLLLAGLLCFFATLWYVCVPHGAQKTSARAAEAAEASHFLVNGQTASDRVSFLSQFGWEVESDPVEAREIVIPAEFDEVYRRYNDMQKSLGFDLEAYRGCRVKKWVYAVTNYPGIAHGVTATVLIHDGQVVGGDITSAGDRRFTHALLMPPDGKGSVSAGDR